LLLGGEHSFRYSRGQFFKRIFEPTEKFAPSHINDEYSPENFVSLGRFLLNEFPSASSTDSFMGK
jgi:hypothetical protein